jgi:hypothetical protein
MKNRPFPHVLIVLLLGAALAQCQQLTIQTEGGRQTVLARSDIESLPHVLSWIAKASAPRSKR